MDHLLKKEIGGSTYIYPNELDKACFQHNMAYGEFKDWHRIAASDKVFREKAFNIAKNTIYAAYQGGLASMVYNFLIKRLMILIFLMVLLKVNLWEANN